MGFAARPNKATLVFEEGSVLHGATVRVSLSAKVGLLFSLQQALPALGDLMSGTAEDAARADDLCEDFIDGGALLSWNIEREDDDGQALPIPTTREGFLSLLPGERFAIITAWVQALSEASAPAPKPSSASASTEPVSITGGRSAAPFEPMAAV